MTNRLRQGRGAVSEVARGRAKGAGLPAFALALCVAGAAAGIAQTPTAPQADLVAPPAWAFNDLACSPFVTTTAPTTAPRVLGSQDAVVKAMFGPGDTLVVSGGAGAGLQQGQEYYVRRLDRQLGAKGPDREHPLGVHTVGWVRVLAVEATVATTAIVHACDGILLDDYLEPFSPPLVAARTSPAGGTAQFEQMGRILGGDEGRVSAGIGQFMTVDIGSDRSVAPGQRFLVFRDKHAMRSDRDGRSVAFRQADNSLPMVQIGEVVVVSVRPDISTVQIVVARDAVQAGDLIAAVR
jgi:hypothetical protein